MSNHFTGLSLGPPLGDQRLDLCDLYAFQSPTDSSRTVIILNANPNADALHPDAIYRVAIDNDGDLQNDIAFSYVFSTPQDGRQTVDVYLAAGDDAEEAEAVGEKIFSAVPVSFVSDEPHIATSGDFTFFAGARSDAFFFDFDGVKELFDTSGKRNFTDLTLPWRITLDRCGFQHRGQRLLDGHRDADQLPGRRSRHQDLGPLQPAPRR